MLCPNCKQEITHVLRMMVCVVGDAYPITEDGSVDINADIPDEGVVEEANDGSQGVWYECPKCRTRIEDEEGENQWDSEGSPSIHCDFCSRCLYAIDAIPCEHEGCTNRACSDCAAAIYDDDQCCNDHSDDEKGR